MLMFNHNVRDVLEDVQLMADGFPDDITAHELELRHLEPTQGADDLSVNDAGRWKATSGYEVVSVGYLAFIAQLLIPSIGVIEEVVIGATVEFVVGVEVNGPVEQLCRVPSVDVHPALAIELLCLVVVEFWIVGVDDNQEVRAF